MVLQMQECAGAHVFERIITIKTFNWDKIENVTYVQVFLMALIKVGHKWKNTQLFHTNNTNQNETLFLGF